MTKTRPKPDRDTRKEDPVDAAWGRGFDSAMAGDTEEANPYDPVEEPDCWAEWNAGHADANY